MKKILLLICLMAIAWRAGAAQCVSTFAGNGLATFSGDGGPALQAALSTNLFGIGIDASDNLYVIDNSNMRIRKINTTTGIISTVVGSGGEGYNGDGFPATQAWLDDPLQVVLDASGNLYFADSENFRIRKVDTSGMISTFAGGTLGYSGDGGPATAASLHVPEGVAIDLTGNVYVADTFNHVIRKVDLAGNISTIAGSGTPGYGGDGGPPLLAQFNEPDALAVDASGNLYIADLLNHCIRKLDPLGNLSTYAGNTVQAFGGDGGPAASASLDSPLHVTCHGTDLYIVDAGNNRIRKVDGAGNISTVAGNGSAAYSGDGGLATSAGLYDPSGAGVDSAGNLYITDYNRVRKVDTLGVITLFAGASAGGTALTINLHYPNGVVFDGAGNTLVVDTNNNRIRRIGAGGVVYLFAGNGALGSGGDGGPAVNAGLQYPAAAIFDHSGNLLIADTFNHKVRKVDTSGNISTFAGNGTPGSGGDGALAVSANLNTPSGLAIDSLDNVYIACTNSNSVRKVNAAGVISKYAGTGTPGFNGDGLPAISTYLNGPHGLAMDSGDNLYIADTNNQRIRKVAPAGTLSTVAGSGFTGDSGDGGPALLASLNLPYAVAVDSTDHIYIADSGNHRIRVTDDEGDLEAYAGTGAAGKSVDGGDALSAQFNRPQGLAVDASDNLWIADTNNNVVRQLYSCVITPTPTPNVSNPSAELFHNRFFPGKGESMVIKYQLVSPEKVLIRVLDSRGREVKTLLDQAQSRGFYQTAWDGTEASGGLAASGLYIIRFELGAFIQMKKAALIR